jgi:two-component system NtrC family response regulator
MSEPLKVLVVDDEAPLRDLLRMELGRKGWELATAASGEEGLALYREQIFNVVLLDIQMPGMGGIEALRRMRAETDIPEIIILTGFGTIESAVECIRLGSYDYLTKPVKLEELELVIGKAAEKNFLRLENISLKVHSSAHHGHTVIAKSPAMHRVMDLVCRLGEADEHVLVCGESGTGKELVSRAVREASPRRRKPFLVVNCGRLSVHTAESELFGHAKGAFTGADKSRAGLFELAHTGTLFMDEVSEMPLDVQVKLLRILETGKFRRLGGNQDIHVDVRFVFASNRDLPKCIQAGTFREDLYHRINLLSVELPPLRERREDIPPLASHFVSQRDRSGRLRLTQEALQALCAHNWPGNVRELRNALFRACILASNGIITPDLFPFVGSTVRPNPGTSEAGRQETTYPLWALERDHIRRVLEQTEGNKSRAAQLLEIDRKTLYSKIERYGLNGG